MLEAGNIQFSASRNILFKVCGRIATARTALLISASFQNLLDCCVCAITWWLFGYAFAFGDGIFIGAQGFVPSHALAPVELIPESSSNATAVASADCPTVTSYAHWFYQVRHCGGTCFNRRLSRFADCHVHKLMFLATAVTVVSGAVAERAKYPGYLLMAFVTSAVVYPLIAHCTCATLRLGAIHRARVCVQGCGQTAAG